MFNGHLFRKNSSDKEIAKNEEVRSSKLLKKYLQRRDELVRSSLDRHHADADAPKVSIVNLDSQLDGDYFRSYSDLEEYNLFKNKKHTSTSLMGLPRTRKIQFGLDGSREVQVSMKDEA